MLLIGVGDVQPGEAETFRRLEHLGQIAFVAAEASKIDGLVDKPQAESRSLGFIDFRTAGLADAMAQQAAEKGGGVKLHVVHGQGLRTRKHDVPPYFFGLHPALRSGEGAGSGSKREIRFAYSAGAAIAAICVSARAVILPFT